MSKIQTIEILDIENVKLEKLRYQKNSLAYMLGFMGIIFSILAAFIGLNSLTPNPWTVVKILMNIAILLIGFLACEKVKVYKKEYSFVMFGFAALCVIRVFWSPLQIINGWSKFQDGAKLIADGKLDEGAALRVKASKIIGSSLTSTGKATNGYLPHSGYLRAALCIVFLLIAAAFFALSGYIAYSKTKKLNDYLKSINLDSNKR